MLCVYCNIISQMCLFKVYSAPIHHQKLKEKPQSDDVTMESSEGERTSCLASFVMFLTEKKTRLMIFIFFSSTSYSTGLKLIYPANPAELAAVRRTLFLRIRQDTLIPSPGVHMTRHLRRPLLALHETGPEATTMDWKHPVRARAGLIRTPGSVLLYGARTQLPECADKGPSGASFPSLTHRNAPQQHAL